MNCRIADDGSVEITWEEWRDYLLLSPSSDLHEVFRYWRHATVRFLLQLDALLYTNLHPFHVELVLIGLLIMKV